MTFIENRVIRCRGSYSGSRAKRLCSEGLIQERGQRRARPRGTIARCLFSLARQQAILRCGNPVSRGVPARKAAAKDIRMGHHITQEQGSPVAAQHQAGKTAEPRKSAFAGMALGSLGVVYGDIGTSPLYALRESLQSCQGDRGHRCGRDRNRLPADVGAVLHRDREICPVPDARGQQGRRRYPIPDGAGPVRAWPRRCARSSFSASPERRCFRATRLSRRRFRCCRRSKGLNSSRRFSRPISCRSPIADPGLDVLGAKARHRARRRLLRPRHGGFFSGDRRFWAPPISAMPREFCTRSIRPLGLRFLFGHGLLGFVVLGSVFLAVTGAEALYADMGHFGRSANPDRLDFLRASGAHLELSRPGRARSRQSGGGGQSLLPARAAMGTAARSSSSRRSRRSSRARPSSPAPSRLCARRSSSACCRAC